MATKFFDTIFASAARTTTENSGAHKVGNARGARFFLDITAVAGTPTLDVKIQYFDKLTSKWFDAKDASFAQKTATGSDDLIIYPGATAATNRRVGDPMPDQYRSVATIGGTTPSFTFSLSSELLA